MLALISMRGQDFAFFMGATATMFFFLGACWMAIGKKNKYAETQSEDTKGKKPASIIDLGEALESGSYEWKKGVNN